MIDQKLKKLVVKEVLNLRKYATKKEIEKLDLNTLNPEKSNFCIYGQMTGSCFSERAYTLLNKCTEPYSTYLSIMDNKSTEKKFYDSSRDWSPLEFYIFQPGANIKLLIKLIKS